MPEQASGDIPSDAIPSGPLLNKRHSAPQAAVAASTSHLLPLASETRRLYAGDWAAFVTWCRPQRHAALPASPATVAAYLASLTTLKHGALARRACAISDQHHRSGHASPAADGAIRDILRQARLSVRPASLGGPPAKPRVRRRPPGLAQLAHMAARCPGDLAGLRDRALLLLAAAGVTGERLLALDYEHIRIDTSGAELSLPGANGRETLVAAWATAPLACPVRALQAWLRGSDTEFGPVFRKVNRWGDVEHNRLRADALRRIWQRRAKAARLSNRVKAKPP